MAREVYDDLFEEYLSMSEEYLRITCVKYLEDFIRESNYIEGELDQEDPSKGGYYLSDKDALKFLQSKIGKKLTLKDLLKLHSLVGGPIIERGSQRNNEVYIRNIGKLRDVDVFVGRSKKICPTLLKEYMSLYMSNFEKMTPWEAHSIFELIHPFIDGNGRVGRYLWLYKHDLTPPRMSFLHTYYYETLRSLESLDENTKTKLPPKLKNLIY